MKSVIAQISLLLASSVALANGYSPSTTKYLNRDFHAAGNAVTDDSAILQSALNQSASFCLDGEGRTYNVSQMLQVRQSLCLKNITLVQTFVPVDSSRYIRSLGRGEPRLTSSDIANYPEDPTVSGSEKSALEKSLSMRTLLIRPGGTTPIQVTLENVKVVYGLYPEGGSRTDGAGIWLENANSVSFNRVECTGQGHGTCIMIYNSSNLTLNRVNIHDMLWAPHRGDRALVENHIKYFLNGQGWNDFPLYEYNQNLAKFVQVRAQEQAVGLILMKVSNAVVSKLRLANVLAKFDTGNYAVQTDGVDLNSCMNVSLINSRISRVWEGVDMVGGSGMNGILLDGVTTWDTWNFGYKIGYNTSNVVMKNGEIHDSGIAGIVVGPPAHGIVIDNMAIRDTGYVDTPTGSKMPWPNTTRSGVQLTGAQDVHITNSSSEYNVAPGWAQYGFFNDTAGNTISNSNANGYSVAATRGF